MENLKITNANKLFKSVEEVTDYIKKNIELDTKNTDSLDSNHLKEIRDIIANLGEKNFDGRQDDAKIRKILIKAKMRQINLNYCVAQYFLKQRIDKLYLKKLVTVEMPI